MTMFDVIYLVQICVLLLSIVMIVMAHHGFNGFAIGLVALGVMLVLMRVELLTHALGAELILVTSTLATTLFCWQIWSIWKERHDHLEYLHWRARYAGELQLINEWQKRKVLRENIERELEQLRSEHFGDLWNAEGASAQHTQYIGFKRK